MRGLQHLWPIVLGGGPLALIAMTSGCAAPGAKLLRPTCQRVQRGEGLDALAFTATVETRGLLGEQLIYEAALYNSAGRPIKSASRRYRNKAGTLAASKTLMVLESPWTHTPFGTKLVRAPCAQSPAPSMMRTRLPAEATERALPIVA